VEYPRENVVDLDVSEPSSSAPSALGEGPWGLPEDPRTALLGRRGLVRAGLAPQADATGSEEAYRAVRLCQGVLEGSTEIPPGSALALEYNLDGLSGVSFDKGCYIGQEMTARSHHVLVVRKRALPWALLGPAAQGALNETMGAQGLEIRAEGARRALGRAHAAVSLDGEAVAVAVGVSRLRESLAEGSEAFAVVGERRLEAVRFRPLWWPAEWGRGGEEDSG